MMSALDWRPDLIRRELIIKKIPKGGFSIGRSLYVSAGSYRHQL